MAVPLALTGLVEVNTGDPPQLLLFGPKRRKVIVPVGFVALKSAALSVIWAPKATEAEALVEMDGASRWTVVCREAFGAMVKLLTLLVPEAA